MLAVTDVLNKRKTISDQFIADLSEPEIEAVNITEIITDEAVANADPRFPYILSLIRNPQKEAHSFIFKLQAQGFKARNFGVNVKLLDGSMNEYNIECMLISWGEMARAVKEGQVNLNCAFFTKQMCTYVEKVCDLIKATYGTRNMKILFRIEGGQLLEAMEYTPGVIEYATTCTREAFNAMDIQMITPEIMKTFISDCESVDISKVAKDIIAVNITYKV